MPYPVQNLIQDRSAPIMITPDRSVSEALALMIEYDFSQLPVVDEDRCPKGMITYGSIVRALGNFGLTMDKLQIADAVVKAPKYHPEDDLFDLLDRLKETNAVLIVDSSNRLVGIVTTYDSTEYFRRKAEDMMLVEDVESMVKDLVLVRFTDQDDQIDSEALQRAIVNIQSGSDDFEKRLKKALAHYLLADGVNAGVIKADLAAEAAAAQIPEQKPKAFDDLTLYEYIELLLSKDAWDLYGNVFGLDRGAIRKLLDEVRATRNALSHFRPDITAKQRDQLRFCVDWLASYPVELFAVHTVGTPTDWSVEPEPEVAISAVRELRQGGGSETQITPSEEVLGPEESRYAPLAVELQGLPGSIDRITLNFGEIEAIIDGDLPSSARSHRNWWANDSVSHVQSQQWLDAGWRVAQINMTEERVTFARIREREQAYIRFFSELRQRLEQLPDFPLRDIGPDGVSWHTLVTLPEAGPQAMLLVAAFSRGKRLRVELYIDTGSQEHNKAIFDALATDRQSIEQELGESLSWERLDDRRASRIAIYRGGSIDSAGRDLETLQKWVVGTAPWFYAALTHRAETAYYNVFGPGTPAGD